MCGGKSYRAPAPQPLPKPPPLPKTPQAAPIIDEGFGVDQKLQDIRNSNPLLVKIPGTGGGPTIPTLGKTYNPFKSQVQWRGQGNQPGSGLSPVWKPGFRPVTTLLPSLAPGTGFTNNGSGWVAGADAKFSTDYLQKNKLGGY